MNKFHFFPFYLAFQRTVGLRMGLEAGVQVAKDGSISITAEMEAHWAKQIQAALIQLQPECFALGLPNSNTAISEGLHHVTAFGMDISLSALTTRLSVIENAIRYDLGRTQFVWIHHDHAKHFNQEYLFGEEVGKRFPNAAGDISAVGNCIAVGLQTAAVFHLMRVAEHGLRALARKFKVKLTDRGSLQPYEYAEWDKIITGISNAISKARALARGPKRKNQLEALSDAAQHCTFMKDIWRNTVSHTSAPYSPQEAISAFTRVQDFMLFLEKYL